MANDVISLYATYKFLKRLTTPFEQWEAYQLGIIDENGNIKIKARDRKTVDLKRGLPKFDLLVLKIKKLLEKVPGGKSRIASYAAALYLIKEDINNYSDIELESKDVEQDFLQIMEDIANTTGSDVAGTGDDKVHWVKKKKRKGYKEGNKLEAPRVNKAFEEFV